MELAIHTEHLTKFYSRRLIAVNDLNMDVPQGSVFGLLGPNGAGKTTTLRLLLGLQRPSAGRAEVFGKSCGVNAVGVRRMIGYLPTNPQLPGHLRPIEYLDLLGQIYGMSNQSRTPRLASLLRAVGLLGATSQLIRTFSTGMCTRLGIAASLVGDPPLLIWDEPTAGLDPSARRFTLDLIRELAPTRTIVVSSHILNDIDQVCSHVGVMHEGRMIFCGPIREMKQRLRRDSLSLDLGGSREEVARLAAQVGEIDGVQAEVDSSHALTVRLTDQRCRSATLIEILKLIQAAELPLQTIRPGQNETEDVYLQLLQEDEAHGFNRFDRDADGAAQAVSGNPAV